jgi:hypothetical protein
MPNKSLPRCRVIPLADHQVSLTIDGHERTRWHYGTEYPRPFFFPLLGPSGESLTRMGHPGAPDHDHHRSIWFAHNNVVGNDFWSDQTPAQIRQLEWLSYEDGDDEARLAVKLGWFDGHDPQPLLEQEVVVGISDINGGETGLEFQLTFRPTAHRLEFEKTNFGFLGVRVAKSISTFFGEGKITDDSGREGESAIFATQAKWMDYSGPSGTHATPLIEGITYVDHADNPGHPSFWHVREDGWMIASPCMSAPVMITRDAPLIVRYLLYAHRDTADASVVNDIAERFWQRPGWQVAKSRKPHTHFEIRRLQ